MEEAGCRQTKRYSKQDDAQWVKSNQNKSSSTILDRFNKTYVISVVKAADNGSVLKFGMYQCLICKASNSGLYQPQNSMKKAQNTICIIDSGMNVVRPRKVSGKGKTEVFMEGGQRGGGKDQCSIDG